MRFPKRPMTGVRHVLLSNKHTESVGANENKLGDVMSMLAKRKLIKRLIKCIDQLRIRMQQRAGIAKLRTARMSGTTDLLFVCDNRVSLSRETPTRVVLLSDRHVYTSMRARARALEHSRFRWRRSK